MSDSLTIETNQTCFNIFWGVSVHDSKRIMQELLPPREIFAGRKGSQNVYWLLSAEMIFARNMKTDGSTSRKGLAVTKCKLRNYCGNCLTEELEYGVIGLTLIN